MKKPRTKESYEMEIRELTSRLEAAQQGRIELHRSIADLSHPNIQSIIALKNSAEKELAELRQQIHEGKIWNTENPRWTPRTQSALGLAAKEAMAQGATYVGTEHVLLGLLKQGEGIAHRHFLACGMSYEKAEYAMRVGRHS